MATYFVSNAGSDSDNGLTVGTPFATIQKGANVAVPGDTITVADGTYTDTNGDGQVVWLQSPMANGTAALPITIQSTNPLGAVLSLPGTTGANAGFRVSRNYWRFLNLTLTGGTGSAGTASNNGFFITPFGSNTYIQGCHIYDIGRTVCSNSGSGFDGVLMEGADAVTVTRCRIHGCYRLQDGEGSCSTTIGQNDHGIYTKGGANHVFTNNVIYDQGHGWPIHLFGGTVSDILIAHNTMAGRSLTNAPLGHIMLASTVNGARIINNISYDPNVGMVQYFSLTATSVVVSSNLCSETEKISTHPGVTYTGNIQNTDPLFVDEANDDYQLTEASPAVSMGADLSADGITTDFAGDSRPLDGWDVGAYEFQEEDPGSGGGGAAFDYAFTEQNTAQVLSSVTYGDVPGASIASASLTVGKQYLILVTAQISDSAATSGIAVKMRHGTTDFTDSEQFYYAGAAGNYTLYTWFTVWTAVSGEALTLQGRHRGASPVNFTVDQVAMLALNLTDDLTQNTDWFFNEVETDSALSTTPLAGGTVTFTPAIAGHDWLVLSLTRLDHNDSTTGGITQLIRSGEASSSTPSTRFYPATRVAGDDFFLQMLSRVFTLGASSNTFTEQSATSTGTNLNRVYSAVFTLNLNKFSSHAFAYTDGDAALSASDYATELQTVDLAISSDTDTIIGAYWGFDRGSFAREAEFRVQAYIVGGGGQVDQPAGQTSGNYQFDPGGNDSAEEDPLNLLTLMPMLGGNTYRIDLDASSDAITDTPTGQHRGVWAFTLGHAEVTPQAMDTLVLQCQESALAITNNGFSLAGDSSTVQLLEAITIAASDPPLLTDTPTVGVTDSIGAPVVPIYVTENEE